MRTIAGPTERSQADRQQSKSKRRYQLLVCRLLRFVHCRGVGRSSPRARGEGHAVLGKTRIRQRRLMQSPRVRSDTERQLTTAPPAACDVNHAPSCGIPLLWLHRRETANGMVRPCSCPTGESCWDRLVGVLPLTSPMQRMVTQRIFVGGGNGVMGKARLPSSLAALN
jgi:hypothetical protein